MANRVAALLLYIVGLIVVVTCANNSEEWSAPASNRVLAGIGFLLAAIYLQVSDTNFNLLKKE